MKDQLTPSEWMILAALDRAGKDATGVMICDVAEAQLNHKINFGMMYPRLDNLEERGFVSARRGFDIRVGRHRRYWTLTDAGRGALLDSRDDVFEKLAKKKRGWFSWLFRAITRPPSLALATLPGQADR